MVQGKREKERENEEHDTNEGKKLRTKNHLRNSSFLEQRADGGKRVKETRCD